MFDSVINNNLCGAEVGKKFSIFDRNSDFKSLFGEKLDQVPVLACFPQRTLNGFHREAFSYKNARGSFSLLLLVFKFPISTTGESKGG